MEKENQHLVINGNVFKNLDQESRFKVWTNLLNASNTNLNEEAIQKLSQVEMNGRQIKNCIRMGQCLAKEYKKDLSREIIEEVIPFVI